MGQTYDTDFLPVTLTVNGQDPMYFFKCQARHALRSSSETSLPSTINPCNGSAVPVLSYGTDLHRLAEYKAGRELLGLLTEVLAAFRTVNAFEPHLNSSMVPQDLDRVSVGHTDAFAENESGAIKRIARQSVM